MRLDKYLKVSRIIKRRTLAKDICDSGKVTVNGKPAKAGSEVKVGDRIQINFGSRVVNYEIIKIADNVSVQEAKDLYNILN